MSAAAGRAPEPSRGALAAFASPQIALAALNLPVFTFLAPFYAAERGLDLAALGAILIAARLIDAVTDPAMGAISDAWRTRFGRRKVWLALSTPFVCLSVWMAFVPPAEVGLGYFAVWIVALMLSWTVALTPYFAWCAELSDTYEGRARATAWREGAFLIGTLAAAILFALASDASAGRTAGDGLRAVALAVVLVLPPTALLAIAVAPERERRGSPVAGGLLSGLRPGLRAISANAPFRRLIFSFFINSAANALPASLFLFFATWVLEADAQMAGAFFVAYLAAGVLAAPFWSWAARRYAKHRAWGVAMLYSSAIFALAPLLGPGDDFAFLAICIATGAAFGADMVLPSAMQADVVDVDTANTGEERTGLYFAVWSVVFKTATAIGGGLGFVALSAFGFDAAADAQSEDALLALALLYAGVPVILKAIAVAIMWRFPLDADAQRALQERILAQSEFRQ